MKGKLFLILTLISCCACGQPKNNKVYGPLHVDVPEYAFINYDGNNLRYDTASPSMRAFFDKWYRADDIRQKYEITVYTRTPGDPGFIDLSSTVVRQRIHQGKGIRRMVPKAVADYIKENGLYA